MRQAFKQTANLLTTHESAWRILFCKTGKEKYNPRHKFKKHELRDLNNALNSTFGRKHNITSVSFAGA